MKKELSYIETIKMIVEVKKIFESQIETRLLSIPGVLDVIDTYITNISTGEGSSGNITLESYQIPKLYEVVMNDY